MTYPSGYRKIASSAKPAARTLALCVLIAISSACTYDFEQFNSPAPKKDMTKADMPVEDMPVEDIQEDLPDMVPDMPIVKAGLGGACTSDAECADDGTCYENYCTKACDQTDATSCGEGQQCVRINDALSYCMISCTGNDRTCAVEGRAEVTCTTLVEHRDRVNTTPSDICQVDADADGVPDFQDNCPGASNANQWDRDADGVGDACDDKPLCHPGQEMGKVQYPAVDFAAKSVNIPEIIDGLSVPIFAEFGTDDQPSDLALTLSRGAKTFDATKSLYPSIGQQITPTGFGDYLVSPGRLSTDPKQHGRYAYLRKGGNFDQGFPYNVSLYNSVYGSNRQGDIFLHTFTEPDASGSVVSRVYFYDQTSGTHSAINTVTNLKRVPWHVTRGAKDNLIFYSEAQTDANNSNPIMRMLFVDRKRSVRTQDISLPTPATGVVVPLVLQGANGATIVIDRRSGQGWRVDLTQNTLIKEDSWSVPITLLNAQFATIDRGMSFIVFGQQPDDPSKFSAVEYNLGCFGTANTLDADMDGTIDLEDSCPTLASDNQTDTDGDGLGDVCDEDQDNDGIPNMLDAIVDPNDPNMMISQALDTDNDGTPNDMDDDDDQDGIPDSVDRFPLDTDNDGLDNALDTDDDGDGYSDASELSQRTDPLDPLSFSNAGVVAYVKISGGQRTLHVAPLSDVARGVAPAIPLGAVSPHWPALAINSQSVLTLTGEAGVATSVVWDDFDDMTDNTVTIDTGTALVGASPTSVGVSAMTNAPELRTFVGTHSRTDMPGAVAMSTYSVADMMWSPLVTSFTAMAKPSLYNTSTVYTVAGPQGCDACQSAFRVTLSNGAVSEQIRTEFGMIAYSRRLGGPQVTLSKDDSGTTHLQLNGLPLDLPAGITKVNSIVSLGFNNSLLLSGATEQGSYDLWWFDGRFNRWRLLLASSDDLVEIDWQRSSSNIRN